MEYVGARIYRRPDTIEEKIIIEKNGKKERCIRRGLDLAAFSYTACTYIELASRERATRLMTETREGEDPWWKKCRDSSRFVRLRYPVYEVAKSISRAFSRAKKTWERRKENEQRVPCHGRNRNCIRFIHPREVERSRGTFLVKFSSPRPIPIRIDRPLTRSNSGGPRVGSGRGSSRKKRGWVWLAPTLGVLRQWQRGGRGAGGRPVLSPVVRGPFHQPRSARGLSSLALSTTLPIVVSFDHVYYHHTSKSNGFPANNRCGPLITAYLVNQGIRSIPKLESPRARVSGDFNAGPNDRVLLLSF